jgi:hypothetical protein
LKQIDYDYSLLDIEESDNSHLLIGEGQGEVSEHQTSHSRSEERENPEISPLNKVETAKPSEFEQPQETPVKEPDSKDDEDLQNRAKIFRTF